MVKGNDANRKMHGQGEVCTRVECRKQLHSTAISNSYIDLRLLTEKKAAMQENVLHAMNRYYRKVYESKMILNST